MAVNVSVTFPETVLEWIDRERGEIKRSTYVIKLLQQTHEDKALESKTTVVSRNYNSRQNGIRKANLRELLQTRGRE